MYGIVTGTLENHLHTARKTASIPLDKVGHLIPGLLSFLTHNAFRISNEMVQFKVAQRPQFGSLLAILSGANYLISLSVSVHFCKWS